MKGDKWYTASALAGLPGMPSTDRGVRVWGDTGRLQRRQRTRGKGYEYSIASLPLETQIYLMSREAAEAEPKKPRRSESKECGYDRETIWRRADKMPEKDREVGHQRARLLGLVVDLMDQQGITFRQAAKVVGKANDEHPANLRNWYYGMNGKTGARHYDRVDWPAVLVNRRRPVERKASISPDAWDFFKADYLRPEAPSYESCYRRLTQTAAQNGWTIPSLKTLKRRIDSEVGFIGKTLARKGIEAVQKIYPAQKRDRSIFRALEAVNADGHKFDVFVRWPDGEIGRPMMVAWQDLYSGKILSWRMSKTENTDSYRLSLYDILKEHGCFSACWLDNGRGIASKYLTGGTANRYRFKVKADDPIGLLTQVVGRNNIHWTKPYSGQSKPIERAFRDFCDFLAKDPRLAGAYTGNNPTAKPENYGQRAVDLDTFLKVVDECVKAHNIRPGRRTDTAQGRSFEETFRESYKRHKHLIPQLTSHQLRQWMMAAQGVTANKRDGSITLLDNRFWHEDLATRFADRPLQHRKVVAYFDPDNLHAGIHVYDLDGREVAFANCIARTGFNDTEAAREHNRARNQFIRATKEQLAAQKRMDIQRVGELLDDAAPQDEPPTPQSDQVVHGVFKDRKRVAGSDVKPNQPEPDERHGFGELIEAQRQEWLKNRI